MGLGRTMSKLTPTLDSCDGDIHSCPMEMPPLLLPPLSVRIASACSASRCATARSAWLGLGLGSGLRLGPSLWLGLGLGVLHRVKVERLAHATDGRRRRI